MAQAKTKGWPVIGSVRIGETKESKTKYTYIKLADNVELVVNGEKVPLAKNRQLRLEKPTDKVQQLYDRGIIDEKKYDERMEKLAEMDWLKYEIVAPTPRE